MKNIVLLVSVVFLISFTGRTQELRLNQNMSSVRTILTGWDQIRGAWLTSSFIAMSNNQPIPERTFPEILTPAQLFAFVPEDARFSVIELLDSNDRLEADTRAENIDRGINLFRVLSMMTLSTSIRTSRTYGDPHIITFDNNYYRNLMVGEFILAKSNASNFEVQARFENINEDASFITAVSMNVGGDMIGIYANEKPDNLEYSSLRINGAATNINNPVYYLPMGGMVSYANGAYTINWASGETAIIEIKKYQDKKYFNVALEVRTEDESDYTGLTASSKGKTEVDIIASGRIDPQSSLFLYSTDRSAEYYSSSNLRVKKTLTISPQAEASARAICEEAGVTGAEMEGCVYDYAHYSISPSARPDFVHPVDQITLAQLEERVVNNNSTVGILHANNIFEEMDKEHTRVLFNNDPLDNNSLFMNILRSTPSIIGTLGSGGIGR